MFSGPGPGCVLMIYDNGSEDVLYIDFYILFCIQDCQNMLRNNSNIYNIQYIQDFLLLQIRIPLRATNFIFQWSSLENTKYFPQPNNIYHVPWSNASEVCYCVKLLFNTLSINLSKSLKSELRESIKYLARQNGVRVRNSLIIKSKDSLLHNVRRVGNVWNISHVCNGLEV